MYLRFMCFVFLGVFLVGCDEDKKIIGNWSKQGSLISILDKGYVKSVGIIGNMSGKWKKIDDKTILFSFSGIQSLLGEQICNFIQTNDKGLKLSNCNFEGEYSRISDEEYLEKSQLIAKQKKEKLEADVTGKGSNKDSNYSQNSALKLKADFERLLSLP